MSYHIARDGRQLGTFTEEEVIEGLENGTLLRTDELWTEGMDDWQPVHDVIEVDEDEDEQVTPTSVEEIKPALPESEPGPVPEVETEPHAQVEPEPDPQLEWAPEPESETTTAQASHAARVVPMAPVPLLPNVPIPAAPPQTAPAAQPAVLYRTVAPSLVPGQYGTAGSAIASMVLGILSLVTCFVTGVPAIICGHLARGKIRRSGGAYSGEGLAVTGLIFGYVTSVLAILWISLVSTGVKVPFSQFIKDRTKEQLVRNEGHELALALKSYANGHANKYPPSLNTLVSEHLLDQAKLDRLQKTDLGPDWKGTPGWDYLSADEPDSDANDRPLLISRETIGDNLHVVIYQDGTPDKVEVQRK